MCDDPSDFMAVFCFGGFRYGVCYILLFFRYENVLKIDV